MDFVKNKIDAVLKRWRSEGSLHIAYALGTEALLIGYLYFIAFFTIETLLPTFVTVRFSLTMFFFFLVLATFVLSLLGRSLKVTHNWNITKKSPILWLGLFWGFGILLVSLIKFPPLLIPIILAGLLFSGHLFWKILFEDER